MAVACTGLALDGLGIDFEIFQNFMAPPLCHLDTETSLLGLYSWMTSDFRLNSFLPSLWVSVHSPLSHVPPISALFSQTYPCKYRTQALINIEAGGEGQGEGRTEKCSGKSWHLPSPLKSSSSVPSKGTSHHLHRANVSPHPAWKVSSQLGVCYSFPLKYDLCIFGGKDVLCLHGIIFYKMYVEGKSDWDYSKDPMASQSNITS